MSTISSWYYIACNKGFIAYQAKTCKSCKGACSLYKDLFQNRFTIKREWIQSNKPVKKSYIQRRDEAIPDRHANRVLRRMQNRLLYSV